MPFEFCPKCNTMMNEVKKQLIVPERLTNSSKAPASGRVQMECPNCHYTGEPSVAG
jgi:DNA-directed RNA polymerase subunit M/transcription elongation factor TFIIS